MDKKTTLEKPIDLSIAKSARSYHSVLPILETACFKNWKMLVSDMEQYYSSPTELKDIDVCISVSKLSRIMQSLKWQTYTVEQDEWDYVTIKTDDGSEMVFEWLPTKEFVTMPELQDWDKFSIYAKDLYQWVKAVLPSITKKNFSPVLTWVYIHWGDWYIKFTWTDSFRLGEYKVENAMYKNTPSMILPKKFATTLLKILSKYIKSGIEVYITKTDSMVKFDIWDEEYICLLIQWSFPQYHKETIMPTEYSCWITYDRKTMLNMIQRHDIFTRDANNYIEINWWYFYSETDEWVCKTYMETFIEWENTKYGINAKYIKELLSMDIEWRFENIQVKISKDRPKEWPITFLVAPNLRYVIRPLIR